MRRVLPPSKLFRHWMGSAFPQNIGVLQAGQHWEGNHLPPPTPVGTGGHRHPALGPKGLFP